MVLTSAQAPPGPRDALASAASPQEAEDPLGTLDPSHCSTSVPTQGCRHPVSGTNQDRRCRVEFPPQRNLSPLTFLITTLQVAPRDPAQSQATLSLGPQGTASSRCLGAQRLPSEESAFTSVLGLCVRFHLQKGFHCFQKGLWRPHNRGCSFESPVQTSKSHLRLLNLERQFCIKKCRQHTPRRPWDPRELPSTSPSSAQPRPWPWGSAWTEQPSLHWTRSGDAPIHLCY